MEVQTVDERKLHEQVRESVRQRVASELMRISEALSPYSCGDVGMPTPAVVKAHVEALRLLSTLYQLSDEPDLPVVEDPRRIPVERVEKMIASAVSEAVEGAVASERERIAQAAKADLDGARSRVLSELGRIKQLGS